MITRHLDRVRKKKRITVVLEVESDEEYMLSDKFIEDDLRTEINCASNFYKFVEFSTKVISE